MVRSTKHKYTKGGVLPLVVLTAGVFQFFIKKDNEWILSRLEDPARQSDRGPLRPHHVLPQARLRYHTHVVDKYNRKIHAVGIGPMIYPTPQ